MFPVINENIKQNERIDKTIDFKEIRDEGKGTDENSKERAEQGIYIEKL